MHSKKKFFPFLAVLLAFWLGFAYFRHHRGEAAIAHLDAGAKASSVLTKEVIASAFDGPINSNQFPETLDLSLGSQVKHVQARYTLDPDAQNRMERLFASYKPDYGAFVALDAATGRILSLVSYTREPSDVGNLTLRSTFPAASVFKIVTATAALDQHKISPDTVIPFTGGMHTLYRRNVSKMGDPSSGRHMTLREAFAKSVNTVFAKIGLFILDPFQLVDYAKRFQFNQSIAADMPVQPGRFVLAANDKWAVAEAASGFDKMILMSPVQGALMAASVVNDGTMMEPYVVDSLTSEEGAPLYRAESKLASHTMAPATAAELRGLMRETVRRGTSHRAFREFWRRKIAQEVEVGGKTGSLHGIYPKGKYDWFVGYALSRERRIAVAALTINEDNWRVKSSYLACHFIEDYFQPPKASRKKKD